METRIIKPEHFNSTVWSGGISREILIFPPDAEYGPRNFQYRVSTAVVESRESVFTDLPDYNRFIIPLSGELTLTIDQKRHHLAPFSILAFDGAAKTSSLSGPNLTDLNLMVRKGYSADIKVVYYEDLMEMDLENDQLIVRIQLDGNQNFDSIQDAVFKPMGFLLPSPVLEENQLGVVITLPQNPNGPALDDLSFSDF